MGHCLSHCLSAIEPISLYPLIKFWIVHFLGTGEFTYFSMNDVHVSFNKLVSTYSSTVAIHSGIEKIINKMASATNTHKCAHTPTHMHTRKRTHARAHMHTHTTHARAHTLKRLSGRYQVIMTTVCTCILCGPSSRNQQVLFYTCTSFKNTHSMNTVT
jgi:hypothetical protein